MAGGPETRILSRYAPDMTLKRGPKRKAWIIIADAPRPPFQDQVFGGVAPGNPLAVFPARTNMRTLRAVVDAFVQNFLRYPSDMVAYLTRDGAPYRAQEESWGQQVMGGFNPYVEAIRVDDLRVVMDTETGEEHFEYTRRPPIVPHHLRGES